MADPSYKYTRLPDESHEFHPASREKNIQDSITILGWLWRTAWLALLCYVVFCVIRYMSWHDAMGAMRP